MYIYQFSGDCWKEKTKYVHGGYRGNANNWDQRGYGDTRYDGLL